MNHITAPSPEPTSFIRNVEHRHKLKLIASLYLRGVREGGGGGRWGREYGLGVICHCLITGPHKAAREGWGGGDNAIIKNLKKAQRMRRDGEKGREGSGYPNSIMGISWEQIN